MNNDARGLLSCPRRRAHHHENERRSRKQFVTGNVGTALTYEYTRTDCFLLGREAENVTTFL